MVVNDYRGALMDDPTIRTTLSTETINHLQQIKTKKREYSHQDYNYADEKQLRYQLQQGNVLSATAFMLKLANGRLGQLSTDNQKIPMYAFISFATLVSRTAMDCGVDIETAYALHDLFVQKAETARSGARFNEILIEMINDFCILINQVSHRKWPSWVNRTMNYVASNLHHPITLTQISRDLKLPAPYISVQFKQITGQPLTQYVQQKKVEEAAFLLKQTQTPIVEISTLLAFSSQAYFSTVFKNHMGVTPLNYRNNKSSFLD